MSIEYPSFFWHERSYKMAFTRSRKGGEDVSHDAIFIQEPRDKGHHDIGKEC